MVCLIQLWFSQYSVSPPPPHHHHPYTNMILSMYISLQLLHKRLAAQSLGLLVEVEGSQFDRRLSTFLPSLLSFLDLYHEEEGAGVVQELGGAADCTLMDQLLFYMYVLLTLEKVAAHCAVMKVPAHVEVMNKLWG